jgi:hypothetical protein
MAGARRLQKLAATITPPVNPNVPSKKVLFIVLKKKTQDAPIAVKAQVNNVAKNAPWTGDMVSKYDMILSNT